ncbi:Uncharacterised protein [Segatella copri]|nr:Uncharacterised protein [Segatella copri]
MVCLPAVPLSTKASVFSPCTSLHQILSEERLQLSLASKVKSNSAPASPAIVCTCGNTGVTASSSLEQAVNRVTDTSAINTSQYFEINVFIFFLFYD